MTFELVKNANVEVVKKLNAKKNVQAIITVNDKYQHEFAAKSRVSKHLELMEPTELAERLSGGHFFFIEDQLVDFRDGSYNQGFVHTNDTIQAFMDVLGYQVKSTVPGRAQHRRSNNEEADVGSSIILKKDWSNHNIVVPGYQDGGAFDSRLAFVWNPFVKTINSAFEIVRLICENGAVGVTNWLNSKIPVVNRFHEHLEIANRQIQNKVNSTVIHRVQFMANTRASVADCMLIEQHAHDRLYSSAQKSVGENERLQKMIYVSSPRQHLATYYNEALFMDKNLASQVPSHLSNFDIYNLATEIRTHTNECSKSSAFALDRVANRLMFDDDRDCSVTSIGAPKLAAFSSTDTAFFGSIS